jgi:hypothetical protein
MGITTFGEQVAHAPFGGQVAHAPFGERLPKSLLYWITTMKDDIDCWKWENGQSMHRIEYILATASQILNTILLLG